MHLYAHRFFTQKRGITMKIFINDTLIQAIKEAEKRQLITTVATLMELGMERKSALKLVADMSSDLANNWHELKRDCFIRQSGYIENDTQLPGFGWWRVL